ncbi:two-component system activity regulator YycH [Bacillus sp. 31A1R]|uniref:Two-component system activity regulator YycH n=1 Tax=Robertmurraya mangrovi TaxID=3098077 RepID=A0ABU5IWX6_9BACI|nr:two-component system activity regulator YycH [Bacillus sp. 31A1R]MDZ5471678.1 two-component system activity regulator YycH [Bacillus sp. 31A1R]
MTYENIKSIILTILVVTSIFLTWTLWTYQPNFDIMENSKTVQEVSLGEKKEVQKIVKPDQLFYHQKGNHVGTVSPSEIDKVIKEMGKWSFYRFKDISNEIYDIQSFIYDKASSEIIFPNIISIELYKNILNIKEKDAMSLQFDRIVINMEDINGEDAFVYFISTDERKIYESQVTSSFIKNLEANYFKVARKNEKFNQYFPYEVSKDRVILVQVNQVKMMLYNYLLDPLPIEKFRNALFNDPRLVQKNLIISGEEYTDGSTLMSVNYDTNSISYVNPAQENNEPGNFNNLLQRSIDFVNSHGGWTDNYRYVSIDEQYVTFRLYDSGGYPIFSDYGMSEILQIWGQNEINKYERNNFTLGRKIQSTEITLLSGTDVMDKLKKNEDINPEFIQDLKIGYKMTKDTQGPLIHVEPHWFYKYNDEWLKVPNNKKGGLKHGLE